MPVARRQKAAAKQNAQTSRAADAPMPEEKLAGPGNQALLRLSQQAGQPLPAAERAYFEPRFGQDFSDVRVHTDERAEQMAASLEARAYTVGRHIAFGANEYSPQTPEGRHLLAHELTHVIQQRSAAPSPQMQLEVGKPDSPAEAEADDVANAVLDETGRASGDPGESSSALRIAQRPPSISLRPLRRGRGSGGTTAPAPPRPITFRLFSNGFTATLDAVNNVSVTKIGSPDGGWTFTAAGPNKTVAERTLDQAAYIHVGGTTDALVDRSTITVSGRTATPTPIAAEMDSPPTLSIALSAPKKAANTQSVTVNGVTVEQLSLPASALTFTPNDGDAIHLALGGDAWVFSTITPDTPASGPAPPSVQGFFHVGYFTRYNDRGTPTFGMATPSLKDPVRRKALDDLTAAPTLAARRITAAESERFKVVSLIESGFAGVQTYDSGILSFGIAQWTVNADLPRMLDKVDSDVFNRYLGRYGLSVSAPVRQLGAFVSKFQGKKRSKLGVRNLGERALFLNGKELVNKRMLTAAASQAPILTGLSARALAAKASVDAAKPDLTSRDPAKKAAAVDATKKAKTEINAIKTAMAGLSGVTTIADLSRQAALLARVAQDGAAAANDLIANRQDSEVLRGEEWALRFEMLGQSAGGQDAEIAELRANWTDVSSKSTHGAAFLTLLPNLRGQAALLSSYLNRHDSADRVGTTVDLFKSKKKAEATTAAARAAAARSPAPSPSPADWTAFPWPSGDRRWTTLWTSAVIDEFEAIAIIEVTRKTTSPTRRRGIIKKQFP